MIRAFVWSLSAVALFAVADTASAQIRFSFGSGGYGHGGHYDSGHYDTIPGHYHRHGNHYDYHPPRTLYHHGDHYHSVYPSAGYPSSVYPSTVYPSSGYPSSVTYPSGSYPQSAAVPGGSPYAGQQPGREPGSIGHVDDVAVRFERAANQMCLEIYYNYRNNPGWNETYREAYEILNTAKEIHAMEHDGDRDRMRELASHIDALFHHVQEDVRHWRRFGTRYIGPGGLRDRMDAVEDELHHLMEDIGAAPLQEEAPPE